MSKTGAAVGRHARGMASIRKEIDIDAAPETVWDALRDWAEVHHRLVPGFVVDARMDGGDRIITMFNGAVVRERLLDLDDRARRLAWSIADGPYTHHSASAQVFPGPAGGTRFVWLADVLPHEVAPHIDALMERGARTVKETMER